MTEENQSSAVRKPNVKWRVVDIVVAAIIAVASGVIFWAWGHRLHSRAAGLFEAVTPGFEGLLNAFSLFAGPSGPSLCASLEPHCSRKPSRPRSNSPWATSGASAAR